MAELNEATIGRPAIDIVRVLILQRRNDVIEALEHYRKQRAHNVQMNTAVLQARVWSLFLEIEAGYRRRNGDEVHKTLLQKCQGKRVEDIEEAFFIMNAELDKLKLTRIDTSKEYDRTRVEQENEVHKL